MKRHVDLNPYDVSKHYGLFEWQKCWFCHQEFRREYGYKWIWGFGIWCFSCQDCSCSIGNCNDNLKYERDKACAKMVGDAPPAPPMKSYNNARR